MELASLFRPQAQTKGLSLSTSLAPEVPPRLVGDAFKLNQMLSNLVGNAIKFTAQGGVLVQLSVTHAPSPGLETDPQPAELELCWSVHDSGIGIAPEVQRRLFTPFTQADSSTTRRFGGTGLGLSIVRSMAQRMGGSAGVDSVPGQGSSFWLRLPMACPGPSQDDALDRRAQDAVVVAEQAPSQAPSEAPLDARKTHWLPGMRLLLVDDSDINLDVARHLLERHGAEVHCCADGSQAVQWLRASPDAVDAVLMDVQMPVMDGLEATRLIRSGLGLTRLPVVALTAGALVEERRRTLAAGMNGFISKPIDPDSLVRTLRQVVEEGRQSAWPIRSLATSVPPSVADLPGLATPAIQSRLPVPAVASVLAVPAVAAVLPAPAVAGGAWPTVDGIDAASTAQRLNHDASLFRKILGWLLRDFADLGRVPVRLPPQAQARRALAMRLHKLSGSAANVGAVGVQHHAGAAAVGLHRLIDASEVDAGTADPDQVLG